MRPDSDRPAGDDDPVEASLGDAIAALRNRAELSRSELAADCGISADYLSKIERGDRNASDRVLDALAAVFGMSRDELLNTAAELAGEAEPDEPEPGAEHLASTSPEGEKEPGPRATARPQRPRRGWRPTDPRSRLSAGPFEPADPRVQEVAASAQVVADAGGHAVLDLVEWMLSALRHHDLDHDQAQRLRRLVEAHLETGRFPAARIEGTEQLVHELLEADEELDDDGKRKLLEYARHLLRQELHPADTTAPRVATMPTERAHFVFAKSVGIDADDHVWVNPLATPRPFGDPAKDPRVWRFDDGRVVVDVTGLSADVAIGPRDEQRHRVRAVAHRPIEGVPIEAYNSTELVIDWPGSRVVVEPAEHGHIEGTFPHGVARIHVVTAHNPHSQLLPPDVNRQRNDALRAELDAAGHRWHHAVGRSRDEPHRRWEEASFAVVDADRDEMVRLARAHGQFAIFEWTPAHRALVRCQQPDNPEDTVIEPLGWRARWDEPADVTAAP